MYETIRQSMPERPTTPEGQRPAEQLKEELHEAIAGCLGRIALAQSTIRQAQAELDDAVHDARTLGASWQQIGDAAGMSMQGAHRRWKQIDSATSGA
jgi:hypothetical protein